MKKSRITLTLMALALSGLTQAESPWQLRLRAIDVRPDMGTNSAALKQLDASDELVPELDISYFFTPQLAAELILGSSRHALDLGGTPIGKLSTLPPTLTLQYHFAPQAALRPYAGLGLNYTRFFNVDLAPGLDVSRHSVGPALQAGVDIPLGPGAINVDVKKIYMEVDVKAGGEKLGKVDLDPWVLGLGYGWRF